MTYAERVGRPTLESQLAADAAEGNGGEAEEASLEDLKARAGELGIKGRSSMNKEQLAAAVAEAEAAGEGDSADEAEGSES